MRQKRFLCLKGIVFAWLFTILLAAGGQHVCFAAEENVPQQTVYDDAALLTPEEIETLESELNAAGEKTGWNILMLTTDDTNGKTTQEYADDFFDAITENGDGVALLIDMQNREIYISTGGIAISLKIGFPFAENFSSYSVMILPWFMLSSWCRSRVTAVSVQPASGMDRRE